MAHKLIWFQSQETIYVTSSDSSHATARSEQNHKLFNRMLNNKKVIVCHARYNAAKTLEKTHAEVLEQGVVDQIILVDDASRDNTSAIGRTLPQTLVHTHERNLGYGGNQKTCYRLALEQGADIVIMVHPDYQYTQS